MISILQEKLKQEHPIYTDEQVVWLLEHIGDSEASIRDDLVFYSFAKSLDGNDFTEFQYFFLVDQTIQQDLLFFKLSEALPSTLTRTFAALLLALLVKADGQPTSRYYGLMTAKQRDYCFLASRDYLDKEKDFTGYSDTYGWVHGFAHGGNFLRNCLIHPEFPKEDIGKSLKCIENIFHRLPEMFITGEERRLASAIYQPLLEKRLTQMEISDWLSACQFSEKTMIDRVRLACFENFLAAIYFHLTEEIEISLELKESLMAYLREY